MGTREDMRAQAHAWILQHSMLDADAVGTAVRADAGPDLSAAVRLRTAGVLIGLPVGDTYLYPAFQFDLERPGVRPPVAEVNQLLGAGGDPWGVASWWLADDGRLPAGVTPADLAASSDPVESARVLALARSLIAD